MRIVAWGYLLYLLLPIILLFVGSFGQTWTNTLLPNGITTEWYRQVFTDPSFMRAFVTSLQVTLSVCVLAAACALPFCFAVYFYAGKRLLSAIRIVSMLPVAIPELVLGFGFILAFSTAYFPWLGASWLLVVGITVVTVPYLIYTLLTDLEASSLKVIDQSAQSLGAGWWSRFVDIYLPIVRHSLFSGLLTVAALAIGEFQISNLIAGFLNRPYPVVLLQAFYGATGFACAATVVLLLIAFCFTLLSFFQQALAKGQLA